eukprot:6756313-Pyramimonas_sp.AAC.1
MFAVKTSMGSVSSARRPWYANTAAASEGVTSKSRIRRAFMNCSTLRRLSDSERKAWHAGQWMLGRWEVVSACCSRTGLWSVMYLRSNMDSI